jgi:predicted DCC family thiol-disulfide oxidoreductase YuxK
LRSQEGRALAARYHVDVEDPETFLFVEEDEAFAKSNGIVALSRHLRWPARAIGLIRFLPASIRDRLYTLIARNRYRLFGRMTQCMVPDADTRQRFSLPEVP